MKTSHASFIKKLSPMSLIVSLMTLLTATQAYAGTAYKKTTIDLTQTSGALQDVIDIATGPVAKIVAILAIIGGAVMFSQGREINEGLKTLGIVAITIGMLLGVVNLFNTTVGAGI